MPGKMTWLFRDSASHRSRVVKVAVAGLCFLTSALAHQTSAFRDPSPHKVELVTVEDGVRLEVLDWGGSGRPVVLLAGLGVTAHVFDGFAEKLAEFCHVFGISRRGYGASSRPASGYTEERLAEDDLRVFEALQLVAPVVAGHSVAGNELSELGIHHYDRIAGLVYLDALNDGTDDYNGFRPRHLKVAGIDAPATAVIAFRHEILCGLPSVAKTH